MTSHSSQRSAGGPMTWASSRRLVITNDIPQIVGGSTSARSNDRPTTTIFTPSYSVRSTGSPTSRGGFQSGKSCSNNTYTSRNASGIQRNGANCYAWRGGSNPASNRSGSTVPPTTIYYRSATNVCQNRTGFLSRNVPTTITPSARSQQPDTNPTKFFPYNQTITYSAQFTENLVPVPLPYQLQMRRMIQVVQPVIARRDVRLPVPTPVAISKNVPVSVEIPRRNCDVSTTAADTVRPLDGDDDVVKEANRDESDGDEEDGRTSPDVLSASIRSNEDTWDFWDRVYSDPELRQSMQERQRDSSMSEILHSDKLCKAQVVFLNVPRLAYGQQHVVRSLIHREINSNLPILDIHITYRKWTIRFYRYEDAIQVLRHFNGFSFRNHKLLVRVCQNNSTTFGDVTTLEEAAQIENEERRMDLIGSMETSQRHPDNDSIWTLTEWKDLMEFKKELISILEGKQTGMVLSEALSEACVTQRRGVVSAAAELWPTGLIRLFSPEVKTIGRCVCLSGHEDMAALLRRAAQEGTPRLMTDSWEPIPPCEIRTEQHLLSYLAAFLGRFGPQHTVIDIPLRLLLKSLSGSWPATGPGLAEWASKRSYQFIVVFEVLYLVSSIRHRRILVEAVQPLSSLKFKFVNPVNR